VTSFRRAQRFTSLTPARRFFTATLTAHDAPDAVATDPAPALEHVTDDLLPESFHNTGPYANNRIECDHGRLKARQRGSNASGDRTTQQTPLTTRADRMDERSPQPAPELHRRPLKRHQSATA